MVKKFDLKMNIESDTNKFKDELNSHLVKPYIWFVENGLKFKKKIKQ